MHALEYFQRIYVINLQHRSDRRREMAAQLNAIGLTFDAPNVQLVEAVRPKDSGGFPSIGTRGCFLSHLGVLRDAQKNKLDRILLFEDDLNFVSDFTVQMKPVTKALTQRDWSIFYGSYSMRASPQPEGDEKVVWAEPSDPIQTAHFIGFRGEAINEIVDFLESVLSRPPGDARGGPMHVDGAYGWYRYEHPSKTTLLAVPQLGYQRSSRTDIHALRWFDRAPGIRQTMGLLRRVMNETRQ